MAEGSGVDLMAFLLFALLFLGVLYLHFFFAHRAWRTIRGRQSLELDMGYVRMENYFSHSFRRKLKQWLDTPPMTQEAGPGVRVYDHGRERIYVTGEVRYPAGRVEREMVVSEGPFACGPNCDFQNEVMVRGDGEVGEGSTLQAIAADGALRLGEGVTVRRWVDAAGKLTIEADTTIYSRATSRTAIAFLPGASAQSLFAPEIVTEGRDDEPAEVSLWPSGVVLIPHNEDGTAQAESGYDSARLFSMGGGTYLYEGNLEVTAPLHVRASLVVRGSFSCGGESLLEGDLKAYGKIAIGQGSMVKGNLVAQGDLVLCPYVYFQGLLQAGGEMRISRGGRGVRSGLPVAAHATGVLTLESNVVIYGKVSSAERVLAVSTPMAWLQAGRPKAGGQ